MTRLLGALFAFTALTASPAFAQMAPATVTAPAATGIAKPAEKPELKYLNSVDLLPQRVLPLPAIRGSQSETLELATLRRMIAVATPERLAQAVADSQLEDPSIFNDAMGRDLARLPATWNLLIAVQDEAEAAITSAKDAFGRLRPYGVDETMPTCVKVDRTKPFRSYPSGHAGLGWSVGWALVRLAPEMAPAILERASDYAFSRQLCGVHFPSDTEASHVLGTIVAERMLADPRLATPIAAARAELAAAH